MSAGDLHDADPRRLHGLHLLGRGALAAGDDRAGVAHAAARGRRLPRDEADDRLLHAEPSRTSAASSSALPPISPIMTIASVAGSWLKRWRASVWLVPMIGSPPMPMQVVWPMPRAVSCADGLVGQRPAPAHHPDRPAHVDVAGHDPDLALLAGRDDPGAVGPDEAGLAVLQPGPDLDHVERRDPLGDRDDHRDPGVGRLEDGVGRARGRDEHHRGVRPGLVDRLLHGVEEREALDRGPALAGGDAARRRSCRSRGSPSRGRSRASPSPGRGAGSRG